MKANKILIVVDMQNDFISGTLGTREAQAIVPNVKKKIKEYVDNGEHVIFTMDTHYENYMETLEGQKLPIKHCIKDTEGWFINENVEETKYEHVCKETFGYLGWKEKFSDYHINQIEIEIIGLCTDICVVSNALILRAMYPNTKITVDANCCAGVTPENHKAALTTMKSCQIDVIGE